MERLLEKNLLRHFQIIDFLLHHQWTTIGKLSNELNIPPRTIRQHLGEINEYIVPAKIERSRQQGIHLSCGPVHSAPAIYSAIYKQSVHFMILEEIFLHEHKNMASLAEKIFLSPSTLTRKIKKINQILCKHHFEIDPRKLDLVGDEKKIYFFYYSYLIEKYNILDGLIPKQELQLIDALLAEFFAAFPQLKTPKREVYAYFNKVRTMLFISLHRIKKGHLLDAGNQSLVHIAFTPSQMMQKKITAYYKIDCSKKILYHLFYCFLNHRYAWSAADLAKKALQDPEVAKIRTALLACVSAIKHTEGLFLPNEEQLLLKLYNSTSYIAGSTKVLYNPDQEFLANLNTYCAAFILRTKQQLTLFLTKQSLDIYLDDSVIESMLCMLLTSWEGLAAQLEKKIPKISTGIFFNTSLEHNRFVLNELSYHLKSRLDLQLVSANTIAELADVCAHFDLLITNLSAVELPNRSIVSVHSHPTIKDFDKIISAYDAIIEQGFAG